MPRGGRREGAGGRPSWRNGRTKPIRVPIALAEKILEIARVLDERGFELSEEYEEDGVIDLTGVAILYSKNGPVVRLADLVRVGYKIKPERLIRNLEAKPSGSFDLNELILTQGRDDE